MRNIYILALLFFITPQAFSQVIAARENLDNVIDGKMKQEIASFTLTGKSRPGTQSVSDMKLTEIPLRKCSDKFVSFEKGDVYNSQIIIEASSESEAGENRIKEVRLIYGRYGLLILPDSSVVDIKDPKFCDKYTKKGKPIATNCRVFRSQDKSRVYFYMLNGVGLNRCEVTWVIQEGKYYSRVLDLCPVQ